MKLTALKQCSANNTDIAFQAFQTVMGVRTRHTSSHSINQELLAFSTGTHRPSRHATTWMHRCGTLYIYIYISIYLRRCMCVYQEGRCPCLSSPLDVCHMPHHMPHFCPSLPPPPPLSSTPSHLPLSQDMSPCGLSCSPSLSLWCVCRSCLSPPSSSPSLPVSQQLNAPGNQSTQNCVAENVKDGWVLFARDQDSDANR